MTSTEPADTTDIRWSDGLAPVAVGWIAARVCIAAGFWLSQRLVDVLPPPLANRPFDDGLFVWDGMFYRMLSTDWYTTLRPDAARFFPLYPSIGRTLGPLLGGRDDIVLLVVSNVSAFAGALLLWRLVREVLGEREAADRSAWMVAVFPAGFVFAFAYTEGLALVLIAGTLLALHRKSFVVAGLLGFLAALLRPVGGLILVPIVVELYRCRPLPRPWKIAAAVVGPLAGLPLAMFWISRSTGDFWLPVTIQQEIRGGFQDPITRVLEPAGEILTGDFNDVYNFVFMWVLIAALVVAVRRGQPLSWILYAAASFVVLASAQVTDSTGRYGLVVVPFIVAIAQWAERRWQQAAVATVSCLGLTWMTTVAWIGRVVP